MIIDVILNQIGQFISAKIMIYKFIYKAKKDDEAAQCQDSVISLLSSKDTRRYIDRISFRICVSFFERFA